MNRQIMQFKEAERASVCNEKRKRGGCDGIGVSKPFLCCLLGARYRRGISRPLMSWSRAQTSAWPLDVSIQMGKRGQPVDGLWNNPRCQIIEDLATKVFERKRRRQTTSDFRFQLTYPPGDFLETILQGIELFVRPFRAAQPDLRQGMR